MSDFFPQPPRLATSIKETCCIADTNCVQPANTARPRIRLPLCYHCGEAVCRECSSIVRYRNPSTKRSDRVRMCFNCIHEEADKIDAE